MHLFQWATTLPKLRALKTTRERQFLTQADLAARLGTTQTFISKCERGERRLDIVEVRRFCSALGVSFPSFAAQFDKILNQKKGARKKR